MENYAERVFISLYKASRRIFGKALFPDPPDGRRGPIQVQERPRVTGDAGLRVDNSVPVKLGSAVSSGCLFASAKGTTLMRRALL